MLEVVTLRKCPVASVLLSIIFLLHRVDQELNGKQDEPKSEQ